MVNFRSCCLKLRTFTALFAFMTVVFFTYPNLQASATTKKLSPEEILRLRKEIGCPK